MIRRTEFSNLPGEPNPRQSVYGVEPHYQSVIYSEYTDITEKDSIHGGGDGGVGNNLGDDVVRLLYTDAGNARLPHEIRMGTLYAPRSAGSGWRTLGRASSNRWEFSGEIHRTQSEMLEESVWGWMDSVESICELMNGLN